MLLSAAERFRLLLTAQGVHLSYRHNFEIFFIGHFFNFVIPGGVGGDVVKAFYLHKDVGHKSKTSPYTVLFDRFIGLYILAIVAMVVVLTEWSRFSEVPKLKALSVFVVVTFFVVQIFVAVGFLKVVRDFVVRMVPAKFRPLKKFVGLIAESCEHYAQNPRRVLLSVAWGLVGQMSGILSLAAVGYSIEGDAVPLSAYFFVAPLGYIVSSLPISPAGIGVGQAAFLFLFEAYLGHPSALGPTCITVIQIVSLIWASIGVYFYLTRKSQPALATSPEKN